MTIGGSIVAAILLAIAWLNESAWLKKFVLGGVAIWFTFYTLTLLETSFMSEAKLLGPKEQKEFCGFYLDCHMHAAVTGVRKAKTLGDRRATGEFYIVNVNVLSGAAKATLGLKNVDAHVIDASSQRYERDLEAEAELDLQQEFEMEIGPEENFDKEIVFDLPVEVPAPRLDISEGSWIDRMAETFLIGDEDSLFHRRNYFKLQEQNVASSVK
jgi:hypothetical protein